MYPLLQQTFSLTDRIVYNHTAKDNRSDWCSDTTRRRSAGAVLLNVLLGMCLRSVVCCFLVGVCFAWTMEFCVVFDCELGLCGDWVGIVFGDCILCVAVVLSMS